MERSTGAGLGVAALISAPLALVLACDAAGSAASPSLGPPATPASVDGAASCSELAVPDAGVVHVTGSVVEPPTDGGAGAPVPGAMVAVEYGGLYLPWCDLGHASPYYVFGALADAKGAFAMDVREGALGFHAFANGHFYSRAGLDTDAGRAVTIVLPPYRSGQPRPVVMGAGFDRASVHPGDPVTFSATIATWAPGDPLSDESVLVEATHSWGLELDPPSVGKKDNFPDGLWKRTFAAPAAPGTYTYWFSATTGTCITSDLVSATLTVQ